ncbi:MAG TPA: hypothetical protein VGH73_22745 [Thermoanaerobaculia bacterium]
MRSDPEKSSLRSSSPAASPEKAPQPPLETRTIAAARRGRSVETALEVEFRGVENLLQSLDSLTTYGARPRKATKARRG